MLAARAGRYSEFPDPWFADRDSGAVNISEAMRKCVAFLGTKERGKFRPRATAFFITYTEDQHQFLHLVTAEHVISGLVTKNLPIWLRVNLTNGRTAESLVPHDAFFFHPGPESSDVAVAPFVNEIDDAKTGETYSVDLRSLPINGADSYAPSEEFAQQSMGYGGQIVIVGLFRSHYGSNRNIPIVRVGNIAAAPEEPVFTEYAGYIKAYLVEARSIAGLSGSPVLAVRDYAWAVMDGVERLWTRNKDKPFRQSAALLGLMHGHFDVENLNEDVVNDSARASINTGIGVVVPFDKILETVQNPDLVAMRKKVVANLRKSGATADLAADTDPGESEPPTTGDNPQHREDFNRLLSAAVRKPKRGDQT